MLSLIGLTWALSSNTFLVMGDMPYTPIDELNLAPEGVLGRKINTTEHAFLLHVGDMKSGSEPCTDERLTKNKQLLSMLTAQPFIYTPGDNEWTDCDRDNLSPRYDELARLAYLKGLMYDSAYFKKAQQLEKFNHQANMVENARWQFADVEFMTLHIAGTHNGRRQILKSDKQLAYQQADARDANNLQWLAQATPTAKGYIIAFQADIYTHQTEQPQCSAKVQQACDGFKVYRDALREFASTVKKPVLVIHGDTGPYCQQRLSNNLTRLNVPGDYMVSDIAKVTLAQQDATVTWQISSLRTGKPLEIQCR
ncbi:hypothetical protein KAN5_19280 [Pseudoalteromonas sp. KAN5]|nr:hypothetical protein [Pseudoalteromonas sp. S1727]MCF6144645.1 hypothetical protein [Pseudoalteromonas mariniglutinosa NCIMB 1770]TMN74673.1 hypothetical protein CWB85_00410 [Pseudoalteromonas sp. S1727]BDF95090.1 hypothetical protein KAN5_19280 [Pseudoalteromonas sp. KAN5]